jgi:hypothetical protein
MPIQHLDQNTMGYCEEGLWEAYTVQPQEGWFRFLLVACFARLTRPRITPESQQTTGWEVLVIYYRHDGSSFQKASKYK